MFKIIQISDLHFGREDQIAINAGKFAIQDLKPDLVAIAGDLTQRNKTREFEHAVQFLNDLKVPYFLVPGNHDIPLYNFFQRFSVPLREYRKHFDYLYPLEFTNEFLDIVGIDSSDSFQVKNGRLRTADLQKALEFFSNPAHKDKWKMVVTHHPIEDMDRVGDRDLLKQLLEKTDIWLAGHLHRYKVRNLQYGLKKFTGQECISGTFISNRLRKEENSFNMLEFDGIKSVKISTFFLSRATQKFTQIEQVVLVDRNVPKQESTSTIVPGEPEVEVKKLT